MLQTLDAFIPVYVINVDIPFSHALHNFGQLIIYTTQQGRVYTIMKELHYANPAP